MTSGLLGLTSDPKPSITNQIFSPVSSETMMCVESTRSPVTAKLVNHMVNVQSLPVGIVSIHSVDVEAFKDESYNKNILHTTTHAICILRAYILYLHKHTIYIIIRFIYNT